MDWMDEYLYSMGQYKTTFSPADTHIWGVKPTPNAQQKRMLFDASAQSELEYRLLVQESRQAEIDAGMGGSYDAGSAAKEGTATSAATVPDAPVLTSIGTGNAELSAFFTAPASNGGSIITNYKYSINKGISFTTRSPASSASPIKITGLTNGTEYDVRIRAVNSIGDGTISNALSGTPVAPAPSGIVVATTNAVNISGSNSFVPDGTYTKVTASGTRVAGSAVSDKMLLGTGLVYLNQTGLTDSSATVNPYYIFVPYGYILIPPNTTFTSTLFEPLVSEQFWKVGVIYGEGDGLYFQYNSFSENSSTDATIIPTSGWSPSITITAA